MQIVAALACLLAAAHAGIVAPAHLPAAAPAHGVVYDHYAPPSYRFDYAVADSHTGDAKTQFEHRDGDRVTGAYSLIDADGTTRIVEYTADDHNGFQAVVKRIGHPTPAPPRTVVVAAPAPAPAAHAPVYTAPAPAPAPVAHAAVYAAPAAHAPVHAAPAPAGHAAVLVAPAPAPAAHAYAYPAPAHGPAPYHGFPNDEGNLTQDTFSRLCRTLDTYLSGSSDHTATPHPPPPLPGQLQQSPEMQSVAALACLLAAAHAGIVAPAHLPTAPAPAPAHGVVYDHYAPPSYRFDYAVADSHTGDAKTQFEHRDGDRVTGAYSLIDADGTTRIVEYTADDHNGFQAVVKRVGHPTPAPPRAVVVAAPAPAPAAHGPVHAAPAAAPVAHAAVHAAPAAHGPVYAAPAPAPVPHAAVYAAPAAHAPVYAAPAPAPAPHAAVLAAPAPAAHAYTHPAPAHLAAAHGSHLPYHG
ncbi:skin secretory protein xP2-like [Schistocerca gregaria]|uniref:skin secretory protein xP2-like n=1 Tax=Schistocerca gregaria TaxID=7010 RepID=UPI00211ED1CF|nr:skin secretory protein xP2-like [Schistocerca gregaria]